MVKMKYKMQRNSFGLCAKKICSTDGIISLELYANRISLRIHKNKNQR